VQVFVLEAGAGYAAQAGDGVQVHYRCFEVGGSYRYESRDHGPAQVMTAGKGKSYPADFGKALIGARQGAHLLFLVPDAYLGSPAEANSVRLQPDADLLFEVRVYEITPAQSSGKRASRQADASHGGRTTW
jgi:FKBP-type peptidyl-prolyl cis-trans isomerase